MTKSTAVTFAILFTSTYFVSCLAYGETCMTDGITIPLNEEKQDQTKCVLFKCEKNAGRIVLNTITCAPQEPKRGCQNVISPVNLPFPDCCPLVVCKHPMFYNGYK